jgi:lipoic acid synthetase
VTGPRSSELTPGPRLHVRWLGRVGYRDAHALQTGLFTESPDDHLLLLEHAPVYTLGVRGDLGNLLRPPADVGAELVRTDRGGDVTYHGPGQLTGYPILTVPGRRGGGMADTAAYVASVEQLVIDVLADLGLPGAGRLREYPGVWVDPEGPNPRKVCAIGVKINRGRSMHGFALNVDPDLGMFRHIVPCGIADKGVTSLRAEGLDVRGPSSAGVLAVGIALTSCGATPPTTSPPSAGAAEIEPPIASSWERYLRNGQRLPPVRAWGSGSRRGGSGGWRRRGSPRACRSRLASRSGCGPS